MKIVFAPLALDNLRDIQLHIAVDNISAAARVASEIKRTIDMLETYPQIAPIYEGEVRRLVISKYPYLVFYKVDEKAEVVIIATVLHAHQKPPKFPEQAK